MCDMMFGKKSSDLNKLYSSETKREKRDLQHFVLQH